MREYLRVAFARAGIASGNKALIPELLDKAIRGPARWRLDHSFYALPFEVWLRKAAAKL